MNVKQAVPLLYVSDMGQSMTFWCKGLGFGVTRCAQAAGQITWCWLEREGAAVMLQQDEPGQLDQISEDILIFFLCNDVDALYAELVSRKAAAHPPVVSSYGMRQLALQDPDRRNVCFESPATADW